MVAVYDAAYLELALRRGLPLAALDGDLRMAASAEKIPLRAGFLAENARWSTQSLETLLGCDSNRVAAVYTA